MWTLNNVRIYVTDLKRSTSPIIAELNPIDAGSVYHAFGYKNLELKLTAKVIGSGVLSTLESMAANPASSYALVGPDGNLGNYKIFQLNASRDKSVKQTVDQSKPKTAEVHTIELVLKKDA